MIAVQQSRPFSSQRNVETRGAHSGLGYLFAAAVVNRQFREMLLEDPEAALQCGYLGERFELSRDERERLTSVRAHSLADLARTLITV